jgi:hypothetical protein
MGWMTQFVLGCAVIAEKVAGTKQRFASIALCSQPVLVIGGSLRISRDVRLKRGCRAGSL